MTRHALLKWRPSRFADLLRRVWSLGAVIGLICASPATAQLAASASISSDDMLRGRSLSGGRPVATADLSYDWSSGVYAGVSATGVDTAYSGVQFLGSQQFIGYAHRIGTERSIDVGIINSNYSHYFTGGYATDYTEIYAGLTASHISTHIRYSPNYFGQSVSALYGDVDGSIAPFKTVRLDAHVGLLDQLGGPQSSDRGQPKIDWRLGVSKGFGRLDLHAAWTGSTAHPAYYGGRLHGRTAFVGGATIRF